MKLLLYNKVFAIGSYDFKELVNIYALLSSAIFSSMRQISLYNFLNLCNATIKNQSHSSSSNTIVS